MPGYPTYSPEQEFIRPGAPIVRSLWRDPHENDNVWWFFFRAIRMLVLVVVGSVVLPLAAYALLLIPILLIWACFMALGTLWGLTVGP